MILLRQFTQSAVLYSYNRVPAFRTSFSTATVLEAKKGVQNATSSSNYSAATASTNTCLIGKQVQQSDTKKISDCLLAFVRIHRSKSPARFHALTLSRRLNYSIISASNCYNKSSLVDHDKNKNIHIDCITNSYLKTMNHLLLCSIATAVRQVLDYIHTKLFYTRRPQTPQDEYICVQAEFAW